jgi:hypothetical protein
MNRRQFISTIVGAGTGLALEKAIPFNRVWFFPHKIRLANIPMYRGFAPGYHEAFGGLDGRRWVYDRTLEVAFSVPVHAKAVFDRERQVWVVRATDLPDPKIVEAYLIPSAPSGN